jgi:ABC-type molybdenum transport system ATPase subunit/photorepair protein PhrA
MNGKVRKLSGETAEASEPKTMKKNILSLLKGPSFQRYDKKIESNITVHFSLLFRFAQDFHIAGQNSTGKTNLAIPVSTLNIPTTKASIA